MSTEVKLLKAIKPSTGNSFQMEDISEPVIRRPQRPGLLTAILTPRSEFLQTDVVTFDDVEYTAQLPVGKAFSQVAEESLKKDLPREILYRTCSFGLHYNVNPMDVAKRRKMGTTEMLSVEDIIAEMENKMDLAWDLHEELALALLLTDDQNIVSGGPHTQYNFYTDIVGTARPAAVDMDLGSTTIDHFINAQEQRELAEAELSTYGLSATTWVAVCGRNYFNKRWEIEKQEGIARDLQSAKDLVSEEISSETDGRFNYSMFESHDGITYVKYSANIAGTKMIDDDDAYLVPVGVEDSIFVKSYSPAMDTEYVNTSAIPVYTYMKEDRREGVSVYKESNVLYSNRRPKSILHLTTST